MLIASVAGQISGQFIEADRFQKIVRLLNVDAENNLPSTYSSFALLLCGLIIAVIAGVKHKQRDRFAFHWKYLSLIFLYLSIDEAASLHDRHHCIYLCTARLHKFIRKSCASFSSRKISRFSEP